MKKHTNKFYLLLIGLIVILAIFLAAEVKRYKNIVVKKQNTPIISQTSFYVPINDTDPIYGNPGAEVTIIEFMDFNCKECYKTHNTVVDFVSKNPQKARLVWKPTAISKWYSSADYLPHQAAICADQQGKFWPFIKTVMQSKKNTTEAGLKKTAEGVGLDATKWWTCTNLENTKLTIASSTLEAKKFGVKTLPTIFINNKWINTDENLNLTDILKKFIQ